MRIIHRLGALTLVSVVISAFLVSPANADQPESFVATSSARSLDLNILGTHVTLGSSGAFVSVTPGAATPLIAKADGAGVLLVAGTVSHAEGNQAPPKACVLNLPVAGLVAVAGACGEAKTSIDNGAPQATGAGTIAAVELQGAALIQTILDVLQPLLNQVISTVQPTLNSLLGPLLNPLLGTLGLDPSTGLVSQLVDGLKRATALLSIRVGDSISLANTGDKKVVGSAVANGARIDVLPGLAVGGAPLLTIIVGAAKATATFDRGTGSLEPKFEPAIATVSLGLPILGGATTIPVGLGSPLTLLTGTPLESTISLGAGRTSTDADGTVRAFADGVSLQLLKGLNGGVGLELAHAEAAAGGRTRIVTQQQVVTPLKATPALAKTGGDPWLPLTGAALLMAAYGTRRLVVRPVRVKRKIDHS